MQTRKRTLVISIIIGVAVLCGSALVYLFVSQPLTGSAPPGGSEPIGVVPTESLPSDLPTSVIPVSTTQPALPERRRVTVEFPPQMRAGDSDVIRLTLEVDELGKITPTAEIGGNVVTGKVVEIPNLYEKHHVIAEARFDMAGVEISPMDISSQPLAQGQSVTFYWSIRPGETGIYRGTLWLYLRFVDKQNGKESQKVVSAQLVEIEAVNLFGLSGKLARTTGVVGSVVGTVIGFPFFEDILKWLVRRRKKSGNQNI
jgi:hypothetical protein